jgi:amino acid transporter
MISKRNGSLTDDSPGSTWIALASTLAIVLPSGGPAAFFYGFIFCVACNFCISASLGEMASVWPTAGGQYHYAYALSTDGWKRSMVRLCGFRSKWQRNDSGGSWHR